MRRLMNSASGVSLGYIDIDELTSLQSRAEVNIYIHKRTLSVASQSLGVGGSRKADFELSG